jgi:hypothetical protein
LVVKNGSKALEITSADIPVPESLTEIVGIEMTVGCFDGEVNPNSAASSDKRGDSFI